MSEMNVPIEPSCGGIWIQGGSEQGPHAGFGLGFEKNGPIVERGL
jgi:hypothetical protein